jgi:hypothetical protein
MALKRLCFAVVSLALTTGLVAGTAQALDFSLTGGGGQIHIGNGLALPIQQPIPNFAFTPTRFPATLGVAVKPGPAPLITGTVGKPLLSGVTTHPTATGTAMGTKFGYQRRFHVPASALSRPAAQTTVGVKFSNPNLFAVGTNVNYVWPAAGAQFSTQNAVGGGGTGTATVSGHGGVMTYSNALGKRFGGPAHFRLAPGAAAGDFAQAPITIWLKVNGATPPCTHSHPLFGGPILTTMAQASRGCVAGIVLANPTGLAGVGGFSTVSVTTMGATVGGPNVAIAKIGGTTPPGTPPLGSFLPGLAPPVITKPYPLPAALNTLIPANNNATSRPGPWTTGKIVIQNASATPAETFTLSGKDARTAGGGGSIQMVSGSVSSRAATGPNANRGWIRLELSPVAGVPSMSVLGLATTAGLMLLTAGYVMRRRIFA